MENFVNQRPQAINRDKQRQYQCLCIIFQAVNETCKSRSDSRYASGRNHDGSPLTSYQTFLCKLGQICDSEKGGDTITALVVLKGSEGPEYLFTSNARKPDELERTKYFLSQLLQDVGENPETLAVKALHKRVLHRIFEFNYSRIEIYLRQLILYLENCLSDCLSSKCDGEYYNQDYSMAQSANVFILGPDLITQLQILINRARFPRDIISSSNARQKFFHDCEVLIKAIRSIKGTSTDSIIDKYAEDDGPDISYNWCQLRHHLGRLYSYRQAAEVIVSASTIWGSLFRDFTVNYICSTRDRKLDSPRDTLSSVDTLIKAAFPEHNLARYSDDLAELREHGLDEQIAIQQQNMPSRTRVHCEVNLHDYLIKQQKTRPCDFWNNTMFIGTSKPICRLCYYYFQYPENDFQVQPPHMNLYPKWRLPDAADDTDEEIMKRHEELTIEILEQMQSDTLSILQSKYPDWKRNDSRTDSRNWPANVRPYIDSRSSFSGHHTYEPFLAKNEDGFENVNVEQYHGVAI